MDCCENLTPDFAGEPAFDVGKAIGRRTALKRLAGLASSIMFISGSMLTGKAAKFCSRSAGSSCASFRTRSPEREGISRRKGLMSGCYIRAAATWPCRRWWGAGWITPALFRCPCRPLPAAPR